MASVAILVGNSAYRHLNELACCRDDVAAIKELLEATEKYAAIEVIENTDADELKARMRSAINGLSNTEEVFFYFSGHGHQKEDEFYYCATGFDLKRPNETGLSTSELHTLLRLAQADLVVKVVDACNSGTLLVKTGNGFIQEKHGFKNLIQISSCLDTQNSLTGDPLSAFTDRFRAAALRKLEGEVYFTDIIYTLRDEFLQDDFQTPFFVAQGTGRERFVDEAKRLDALRAKLAATTTPSSLPENAEQQVLPAAPSLRELLEKAELRMATPGQVTSFVGTFFDSLIAKISVREFADFFNLDVVEHSYFKEPTARTFIIRVLNGESRSDNFVTAKISQKFGQNRLALAAVSIAQMWGGDQQITETYDLDLNCTMQRVQLKLTLTPKYNILRRIVLVVTCAPSLENCYVFEIVTQHRLRDFGTYDVDGDEIVRRWYKFDWKNSTQGLVEKIVVELDGLIRDHLETTEQRLAKEKPSA
jgi:hypothetical protein